MKKTKWQLQEAKNRLSEVVRKAREEGPQTIALHGDDAVVVVDADEYGKLTRKLRGNLVEFFRKSPLVEIKSSISRSRDRLARRHAAIVPAMSEPLRFPLTPYPQAQLHTRLPVGHASTLRFTA
jgi:antitoxin Phd